MGRKETCAKYYSSNKAEIQARNFAYTKTKKGFLVRKYRNMLHRVLGINKKAAKTYAGLEIMPKDEFYEFALSSPDFNKMFEEYVASGYDRKLCPSIDRIDNSIGYTLSNVQWSTMSENSRRGSNYRWGNE